MAALTIHLSIAFIGHLLSAPISVQNHAPAQHRSISSLASGHTIFIA